LYNLQKLYIAIKEKSAFLIFIDTDLIAVFICWEGIDWLWCQSIFLPNMSNLSEIVKGIELGDFLFEPAIMDKTLRQIAAGSLEIEYSALLLLLTVGGLMPICKHCARMIKRPIRPLPSLNG
jgi:hypothetical protein